MATLIPSPIAVIKGLLEVEEAVGEFIAGPDRDGIAGHIQGKYRERCDQFANLPPWTKLLTEGAAGTLGRMCQPYWDEGGFTGPVLAPSFQGGQCPDVRYTFEWTRSQGGQQLPPGIFDLVGPLRRTTQAGTAGDSASCPDGGSFSTILMEGADGTSVTLISGCDVSATITAVYPTFGGPDECGDPPPELQPGPNPPPDPGPMPGPEPTNDPSNPTGAPLLPIPEYEDPIGGPTPIVGPDPILPTIESPEIPGNSDNQEGGGENVGEPIEGTGGDGDGVGDDITFPEPPPDRVWVGALLKISIPAKYGIIPNSGPAQPVVARVVGNASLTYEGGRSTPYRLRGANIDLFRPNGALKVLGVYVNLLPEITYTVRPVSVLKCPENECKPEE